MEVKKNRYIHGLNGLRTIAVLGVIFYHLLPEKVKGGYLGVPVFFAISGYLITDHLVQEHRQNGKIDIKRFFAKRLSRLYPTLIVMMVASTAYITLFQRNLLNNLKGVFLSCLFYFNNWYQILNGASYFERFNNESPYTHMWYLSVEFQNYILWIIVFIILMKFVKKKSTIFYITMAVAIASAILMAVLYKPGSDPSRVYYGTDTRLFSIWLGSAMAFIWPSNHLKTNIPANARKLLDGFGIGALILLVASYFFMDAQMDFNYYGGMFLVSIFCVMLVAVVVHPGADIDRLLSNPVFDYIGSRSYGIYLWQFPVMIFYEAKIKNLADDVLMHTAIEICLIMLLAELTYRLVKLTPKKVHFKEIPENVRQWWQAPWLSVSKIGGLLTIAIVLVAAVGLAIAPTNQVDAQQAKLRAQITANQKIAEETKKKAKSTEEVTNTTRQANELSKKYDINDGQVEKAAKAKITFYGDSVMLGAASGLNEVFQSSVVDAAISRQVYTASEAFTQLEKQKVLYDTVVVGLGTNGPFSDQQFAEVMKSLDDRKIYWINMRAPGQRTQGSVNSTLDRMAKKYKNLTIIDWYNFSNAHDEWFWDDQTHLRPEGIPVYTKLMVDTLFPNK